MVWLLIGCGARVDAVEDIAGPACKLPTHVADVAASTVDRVPPIDLRKPQHTEIATFALG